MMFLVSHLKKNPPRDLWSIYYILVSSQTCYYAYFSSSRHPRLFRLFNCGSNSWKYNFLTCVTDCQNDAAFIQLRGWQRPGTFGLFSVQHDQFVLRMFRRDASATADVGSRSSWWSHSAGRRRVHPGPTPRCPGSWFAVRVATDQCPWVHHIMCYTASYETIYSAQVSTTTATGQTQLRTLYFVTVWLPKLCAAEAIVFSLYRSVFPMSPLPCQHRLVRRASEPIIHVQREASYDHARSLSLSKSNSLFYSAFSICINSCIFIVTFMANFLA